MGTHRGSWGALTLYPSQLRTEKAPVEDIHFHPAEPRELRASLTWRF